MAILYAVVARQTLVLAEFSAVTGNVGAIARRILEKLAPDSGSRLCFSQDCYIFHFLRSDGITFLCMANEAFGSVSEPPALVSHLAAIFICFFLDFVQSSSFDDLSFILTIIEI